MQKWDAQRAVQDREAQFKSVEEILAEAALSNAQLAVAKSVVKRHARTEGKTETEIAAEVAEMEEAMTERLVFGKAKVPRKSRRTKKRRVPEGQLSLFDLAT